MCFKNLYWAFVRNYRAASARLLSGIVTTLHELASPERSPALDPTLGCQIRLSDHGGRGG